MPYLFGRLVAVFPGGSPGTPCQSLGLFLLGGALRTFGVPPLLPQKPAAARYQYKCDGKRDEEVLRNPDKSEKIYTRD